MNRLILVLLIFIFFINLVVAQQCSCTNVPTFESQNEYSFAIFSGKVLEVNVTTPYPSITFEATHVWKGPIHDIYTITTSYDYPLGCESAFEEGQEYLVYTSGGTSFGEEFFQSDLCSSRTEILSLSNEDVSKLNTLYPDNAQTPNQEIKLMENNFLKWILVSLGILFLLFIIYLIIKIARKTRKEDQSNEGMTNKF